MSADDKTPRPQRGQPTSVDRDRLVSKHDDRFPEEEERTSPHASPLETLDSRTRRTLASTISGRGEISQLREEVRENNRETNLRIDVMGEHVGNLREGFGELAGEQRATNATLGMLVKSIDSQSAQQAQHRIITMTAQVDVEKAEKLDVVDAKKWTRGVIGTVVGGLFTGSVITGVIALVATKC